MTWTKAVCGYALMDGFHKRAVVVPHEPRAWNGYTRWTVDAIGLAGPVYSPTLQDARALAEAHS